MRSHSGPPVKAMLLVLITFVNDIMSSSLDTDVSDPLEVDMGERACLSTSGSDIANLPLNLGFNKYFFSIYTSISSLNTFLTPVGKPIFSDLSISIMSAPGSIPTIPIYRPVGVPVTVFDPRLNHLVDILAVRDLVCVPGQFVCALSQSKIHMSFKGEDLFYYLSKMMITALLCARFAKNDCTTTSSLPRRDIDHGHI